MLLKKYIIDSKIILTRVERSPDGICTTCRYWDKDNDRKGCSNIEIQGSEALIDRCYYVSKKISRLYSSKDNIVFNYNIQNLMDVTKKET